MRKRLISKLIALGLFINFTFVPIPGVNLSSTTVYAETSTSSSLPDKTKDGVILHAFDWSFNTIKAELPNIAASGFKSVQVSPVQGTKDSSKDASKWWLLYQPTNQSIGNAQLGTYDDFKSLCKEAEKYNISIIVDVVMNHMANNGNNDQLDSAVDPSFKQDNFYHNQGQCSNWNSRHDVTQKGIGMPDLNTQNPDVQNKAIIFLNQCVDAGADGFRFDAAKHIETDIGLDSNQSWSGNYWTNVLGNLHNKSNLFIYGEVLQDGTVDNISSYEKFMSVSASNFGGSIRNAVTSNNLSSLGTTLGGVESDKAVDFVETHDTYEDGKSKNLTDTQRKVGWAIAASRAKATSLFFDRPTGSIGDEGDQLWKDSDIKAINEFHNAMVGQNEYLRWTNNGQTMLIDRGTKGTVIINDSSNTYINSSTNLADGTYTNHGSSNCTLNVSNGVVSGNIPANSIVVLYNGKPIPPVPPTPDDPTTSYTPHSGYKVDYDSSTLVQNKSFTIYYKGSLSNSNKVSLHWGYNDWTSLTNLDMTKDSNGFWKGTITIPANATKLDFDFTDGSNWDNNSNKDWHLPVWSNSVPVQMTSAPTAGKTITIAYNGNLASNSSSITLHWGYNNYTSPTDVTMSKQSDGKWTANITVPSDSTMLNMSFKNNSNTWDNNDSNNYNYSVAK
ncbi:carbohydrate-binding protein [Clostridium saccharobutylicum]|uniref:Alpha-amylase n=1 Tax=Clostridium saccharobutylicum DSM 13864 TaxID=1345695 RepID=U5MZL4_CLOSA|nr:carbohydrate-binding protein [Clostridium saccharobutylicum]AGX45116.1 alpha-amylase AmyA [Clostridium saccharobutylicum DSM 13864]AQR92397.1 alpha-amylase precursor [Clostridium saccharobutylicum]AQS02300.1 alpha-amylase precursor [Clostridium saccharobutylicum]AQS16283.1 alpha-amylase precursor [Clostridium saccharobutylicum]MBA2904958.1 alpha-amylase [Clostridium saccharobutylicum]